MHTGTAPENRPQANKQYRAKPLSVANPAQRAAYPRNVWRKTPSKLQFEIGEAERGRQVSILWSAAAQLPLFLSFAGIATRFAGALLPQAQRSSFGWYLLALALYLLLVLHDRRLCDAKIELAKVNATRHAIANASTKTIKEPSTSHPLECKALDKGTGP